jgi:hypothetical protein
MKVCKFAIALLAIVSVSARIPTINPTSYPPLGEPGRIGGNVVGIDHTKFRIALIVDVFGSLWSKPTAATPWIPINSDGTFDGRFITGGQDQCAQRILLFAVPIDKEIPLVLGGASVPQGLIDMSIATAVVDRRPEGHRFKWSGIDWIKKDTGDCIWGPGPNRFAAENAFVDGDGKLHLIIRNINGVWVCSEIISEQSLGYGSYRFYIDSDLNNLPPQIVAGFFTYDDNAEYSHREIDVEYSNGPVVGSDAPWQYVVQPWNVPGRRVRFVAPPNFVKSTHTFLWTPGFVSFTSHVGHAIFFNDHYVDKYGLLGSTELSNWGIGATFDVHSQTGTNWTYILDERMWLHSHYYQVKHLERYNVALPSPFHSWTALEGIPPKGNEKVHLNLWLFQGAPSEETDKTYEVVVSKFEFIPMATVAPVAQPRISSFTAKSEFDEVRTRVDLKVIVPPQ